LHADGQCRYGAAGALDARSRTGGWAAVGEACHFIDLLRCLVGEAIVEAQVMAPRLHAAADEEATVTLRFKDGSIGTVHYVTNGHRAYPKERVEVFCGGRVLCLENFRRLHGFGWPSFSRMRLWRQDKGQRGCVRAFVDVVQGGGPPPIPPEELFEVTRVTLAVAQEARG
jgi:predicted dehydrogenase